MTNASNFSAGTEGDLLVSENEDDGEDKMVRGRRKGSVQSDNEDQVNFKRELACQNPARIDQTITSKFSDDAEGESVASS